MIKSTSSWVVSLAVVVLLVTAGYRLLGHQQWHRVVSPDSMVAEPLSASSGEVGASAAHYEVQSDRSQAVSSLSGLHQRLLAMTEPQRNQTLYLIIRDAGAKCTEVVSSQYFAAASGVWHSDCGNAQNFSIEEGGESLSVIHHIWVDSKAVWDEIGDSGDGRARYEGHPIALAKQY